MNEKDTPSWESMNKLLRIFLLMKETQYSHGFVDHLSLVKMNKFENHKTSPKFMPITRYTFSLFKAKSTEENKRLAAEIVRLQLKLHGRRISG